jgi:hypothetical protein
MVHPEFVVQELEQLLPSFPKDLPRAAIDALVDLRLPG